MTEDPMETYKAMMSGVEAPGGLSERVMQKAHAQGRADRPMPTQQTHTYEQAARSMPMSQRPPTHAPAPAKRKRSVILAVAACTVLAIGLGLFAAASSSNPPSQGGQDGSSQSSAIASPFDFTVRAYADATDTLLSFGPNGMIALDRNMYSPLPQKPYYYDEGYFTGCLFRISGDNLASVTVSIDKGQLYGYTADVFVKSSDPDRWTEALNAKGGANSGNAYSGFDFVQPQESNDGLDRTDPDKLCRVALGKLLGSSTTLDADGLAAMSGGTYSIGLWTNEDYDAEAWNAFPAVIDTLDGARLTVSSTFKDGSVLTKVIELRSADLKTTSVAAEFGGPQRLQVLPEFATDADGANRLHTLYGTVVDESYTPAVNGSGEGGAQ